MIRELWSAVDGWLSVKENTTVAKMPMETCSSCDLLQTVWGDIKPTGNRSLYGCLNPKPWLHSQAKTLTRKSFSQRDVGALSCYGFTLRTSWLLTGNERLMSAFNKDRIWGPQRESSRTLVCARKPPFVAVFGLGAAELECAMQLRWSVLASFISAFFHPFISVLLWGRMKHSLSGICMCFRWLWYSTVAKIHRGQNWFEPDE